MGVCVSGEQKVNKEIEQQLMKDEHDIALKIKLLLLGPGECGKSTILKQMRILHMNGFNEKDLLTYIPLVHRNIIETITTLVNGIKLLGINFEDEALEVQCSVINDLTEQNSSTLNSETIEIIRNLWKDKGIQQCYEKRSHLQLNDSAKYFLDDLERITTNGYIPTEQDALHVRVATTGIVEISFTCKTLKFQLNFLPLKPLTPSTVDVVFSVFDMGGQKSERRKWLSCFDNVNAVIFIAALSDFDIVMREDEGKNRMSDTLELFDEICNSKVFRRTDMILFLNKQDLFIEKLKHSSISITFPDYTGTCSYDESVLYIKEKFLGIIQSEDKKVATHVTSATDTDQVKVVIDNVIVGIVQKNLKTAGVV